MTAAPPTAAIATPPATSSDTEWVIAIERLSYRYPRAERPALDALSLAIRRAEFFGILGPNGGGKSTLFKLLATLLPIPAGEARVTLGGHDLASEPGAIRRQIGVVFQNPSLDGRLSAEENLLCQASLYGLPIRQARTRIADDLAAFGLADRRHEKVATFSGGMQRRVEIAKAILHRPPMLLMDEPSTGLDPAARREMATQLAQLRRERGVTVVMTTHLMDEAERCDRLAILAHGRCVACGSPDELKARIGGDVLSLEPAAPMPLTAEIEPMPSLLAFLAPHALADRPARVVEGQIHLEHPRAAALAAEVANAFPDRLRRITVGKPTLEDVFLHLTGESFAMAEAGGAAI